MIIKILQVISWSRPSKDKSELKFVDLAPTSDADPAGVYAEALRYAVQNKKVLNIALTGPYGAGKSSVINSFLRKYPRNSLKLSLASFIPEAATEHGVSKQEIERSILQQMLYGADANKLPLSRFKRIQTPQWWSGAISLFIAVGCMSAWYLLSRQEDILSGRFFDPLDWSNWVNIGSAAIALLFLWGVLHHIYVKSFGLSLKSISLKDVQIAPAEADKESILNRHLDEIVYFFQSTKYDLVIIEDLDRFKNPDIFVTLREINGIVNANSGVGRRVQFLYALRDDIFTNTDRTKFFEFIIPVIPVINQFNSIDKVLEQGKRLSLVERLNPGFLRDVSRYLIDLRLIQNIFNEYSVYVSNLETTDESILNPNKLLAVLIYKNVLPADFAALHEQRGVLAEILAKYESLVEALTEVYRSKISTIEATIAEAEKQFPRNMAELRRIYAMELVSLLPAGFTTVRFGGQDIPIGELPLHKSFEDIMSAKSVQIMNQRGHSNSVDTSALESNIDPRRTFRERATQVERKSAKQLEAAAAEIRAIKGQISALRSQKFNEVVRQNFATVEECFSKFGENRDLLKFLILEGYLDDTYYQYISLFHSGRLSPNDNKFLIQIRSYTTPDPEFPLDNVAEVFGSMRGDDFGKSYALNLQIMDHMLENRDVNQARLGAAIGHIASNFGECGPFFAAYFNRGTHVPRLISALVEGWPSFLPTALTSSAGVAHAARVLAYAPSGLLQSPQFQKTLSSFVSSETAEVLNEYVPFDPARLKTLDVKVVDLASISGFTDIADYVKAESLYEISVDNVREVLGPETDGNFETRNFTTVRGSGDTRLKEYLSANFALYVDRVLLPLEQNTLEEASAVISALAHEEVDRGLLEGFLAKQAAIFSTFDGVPDEYRHVLVEQRTISPTWENCIAFIGSSSYDATVLTGFLSEPAIMGSLATARVPDGDPAKALRQFLIANDGLEPDIYRRYVRLLPRPFQSFPEEIGDGKRRIVIEEGKIVVSKETFGSLSASAGLQVLFFAVNCKTCLGDPANYPISDDFRQELLEANIEDGQRLTIISAMDPETFSSDHALASLIGSILDRNQIATASYDPEFVKSLVPAVGPIDLQISILNKLNSVLSGEDVKEVVSRLPHPFSDCVRPGRMPKIENTGVNATFVSWMTARRVISSSKITFGGGHIRINTFRK